MKNFQNTNDICSEYFISLIQENNMYKIIIYDLNTGETDLMFHKDQASQKKVTSIVTHPITYDLFTGSSDGSLQRWNLKDKSFIK